MGQLERYGYESAVVLVFLSRGYFFLFSFFSFITYNSHHNFFFFYNPHSSIPPFPFQVNLGQLERYVYESAVVLVFLSRGYFTSRNCLREIRACKKMKKPLILVHERDPAKGGISLQEAMDECPGNNLYIIETDIYAYKDRVNPTTFTHISDVCIYISFALR